MKLTLFIFLFSFFGAVASVTYSQTTKLSLDLKDKTIKEVLGVIENQSEFFFLYSEKVIDVSRKVNIEVEASSLEKILAEIFQGENVNYTVKGRQIVLTSDDADNLYDAMLFTQQASVSGKVTDSAGLPLPGVTVVIVGTMKGTITNGEGTYTIPGLSTTDVLQFSFVGMRTQEITVGTNTTIDVQMVEDAIGIEEVVAIGYGVQKKVSLTGAVDAVDTEEAIKGRPITNVTQALQGNSPGLVIQQRRYNPQGGSFAINVRGTTTTGNNDPLIVIDGIIGGNLNTLNPSDIESVSVLKDAGSSAIYGSRSANGVILITTKKGKAGANPTITYNGMYGMQVPQILFHPVSAYDNALDKNMSLANSGRPPQYSEAQLAEIKANGDGDWRQETLMHNAPQTNHNLSISGGTEHSTYLMSFGYMDQQAFLEKSQVIDRPWGNQRYNFRLNQTITYGKFSSGWKLSYAKITYNEPYNWVFGDAIRAPLTDSFQDEEGRYITGFVSSNQLAQLRLGGFKTSNDDEVNGSISAGFDITPEINVKAVFGGTVTSNNRKEREIQINYFPSGSSNTGRSTLDWNRKVLFTNTNLVATYMKSFGEHDLSILIGAANESYIREGSQVRKRYTDPLLGVPTTGTIVDEGSTRNYVNDSRESSLNSFFGRASYSYANKYFIDATFRADASSNFPKSGRWGYFPSIGGSWRMTEEAFMSDFKDRVGSLKLRANYGILGNQSVNPYQFQSTYSTNTNVYAFNNQVTAGATRNLANENLTWEKSATFDVGVDATLLGGKLNVTLDYFSQITSDILAPREDVPLIFGSGFPTYNVSKVQNRGWEAKVTYASKGTKFSHNVTFSISDALSKLLEYSFGQTENVFQREEFEFVRRVGYPITVYQAYKTNGLYQTQEEVNTYPKFESAEVTLGDWKFVDKNKDGKIDTNDKFILGNPFPRYVFGFNYNVTYKNFDLGVFVQGVLKRDQLIRGELIEPYHFSDYGGTVYDSSSDFWTPENTDAKYPRLAERGSASNNNNFRTGSDMYLFSGAYARLKNIQLGYSFETNGLLSKANIQKMRLYFTAQNVLTISPLKFADPEMTEFNNNYDNSSGANSPREYPTPAFYGMGLDITF
ncbi:TonB-dependent receptor [Sunxiuqinia sp. A32]|uniref:TonB-dependent receptor n=1 Tax=Sunxiuqinia sp. A32 TaxID=3461496 RepID=UPI004046254D